MHTYTSVILKIADRQRSVRVMANMDPDNASILVCGGGGIALDVTRKLKDMGAWVWMLQRSDSRRYQPALFVLHTSYIALSAYC